MRADLGLQEQPAKVHVRASPLIQLPRALAEAVIAQLRPPDRKQLRLTCKAAAGLVDAAVEELKIPRAGPFKGGLMLRFTSVVSLELSGYSDQWQLVGDFARLSLGGQWRGVTSLTMTSIPAVAAAKVICCCPNVETCTLNDIWPSDSLLGTAQVLRRACGQLPKLASLGCLTTDLALEDAELRALQQCKQLTSLCGELRQCSRAGWDAFLSLPLAELNIWLDPSQLPSGALSSWATGMSALTALTLLSNYGADDVRLPTSLVTLESVDMLLPSAPLPNVTFLDCCDVAEACLSRLATCLPSLVHLAINTFRLYSPFNGAPLPMVTQLDVQDDCVIDGGATLAAVFPNLQIANFHNVSHFGQQPEASAIEHADNLTSLYLGTAMDHGKPCLFERDFATLASLAKLQFLDIPAHAQHIQGIASLSCLQSIRLSFGDFACGAYDESANAFAAYCPPAQLHSASLVFHAWENVLRKLPWPASQQQYESYLTGLKVARTAKAAVSWLLQAPSLTRLSWEDDPKGCASMHDSDIYALAANPQMLHIELRGRHEGVTAAVLQRVNNIHASRGFETVHC